MQTQDVMLFEDCYRVRNTVKEKCQFNKNFVRTPSNTPSRVCSSACSRDSPIDPRDRTMCMITEIRYGSSLTPNPPRSRAHLPGVLLSFQHKLQDPYHSPSRAASTRVRRALEPREDAAIFDQPLNGVSLRHRMHVFGRERSSQHFPRLYANISTSCPRYAGPTTMRRRTCSDLAWRSATDLSSATFSATVRLRHGCRGRDRIAK